MKILFIVYDNESHISEFPLGISYLAAVLKKAGHSVKIYSQDIYHYPPEHLTKYLDNNAFDIVGLSFIAGYFQYKKVLEISKAINKSINRNNFKYILGGHGPSPEPEYFLRKTKADFVVIGEGERTIIELSAVLDKVGLEFLNQVNGIAYLKDKKVIKTKPRQPIKDLDIIPFPEWSLFDINHYCLAPYPNSKYIDRTFPVLSSRGCCFKCSFCYRMIPGIRFRTPQNIVDEIQILKDKYHITYIAFYDELLMASPKRTQEICNAILESNIDIRWCCDGRLNFAKPEILKLMKKAGCTFINYGIESYDNEVLKNMHKQLTTQQIDDGLQNTIKEGISPGLNIIFGNIGDNESTLLKGVKLILKYTDYSQMRTIRPVTPYPGSELYYDAIRIEKLKDVADFYENKHINSDLISVNFTDLTDKQFYDLLFYYNKSLIVNYFNKQIHNYCNIMNKIYYKKDASFRGFRQT